ncbi:hypothetical protein GCM10009868_35990 [Terrabacter aerolatus]|uniref:Uncharacterized protein n=1 Tax=Terrabacter aerolatus TaxID=422442 RepID=A0A512CW35_9MICO|nr:hypothetical protein TAE01_02270 [Terrabacter aerolatus]
MSAGRVRVTLVFGSCQGPGCSRDEETERVAGRVGEDDERLVTGPAAQPPPHRTAPTRNTPSTCQLRRLQPQESAGARCVAGSGADGMLGGP